MLLVEDDAPIRLALADLLQDAGYAVVEAIDGFQALAQLRAQRPDLVVLDLMLPGLSGWQFLERAHAHLDQAGIPVVVLSAIEGRGDYAAQLGVAAWFTKPPDMPCFLSAIEQLARHAQRAPQPTLSVHATTRARVLLVEDAVVIRDLLSEHLEEEGYAPEVAGSIEEARRRIAELRPELILLDLLLPGASGWEFLRQRRADPLLASIPVLVLSAAPQDRMLAAKALGADGFVSKPFDLDVLSALIRSFVRSAPPAGAVQGE